MSQVLLFLQCKEIDFSPFYLINVWSYSFLFFYYLLKLSYLCHQLICIVLFVQGCEGISASAVHWLQLQPGQWDTHPSWFDVQSPEWLWSITEALPVCPPRLWSLLLHQTREWVYCTKYSRPGVLIHYFANYIQSYTLVFIF